MKGSGLRWHLEILASDQVLDDVLLKDPHFSSVSGSRFRRVALPLGLMGAGASVCYPAQAVAVVKVAAGFLYIFIKRCVESPLPNRDLCPLKVTGKKVFAAGQWSGAVVSSLFASKPPQPAAKDPASASSPPQVHAHETHSRLTAANSRPGFR